MSTFKRQQRESGIIYVTTVVLMCIIAWLSMNYLSNTRLVVERRTRARHRDLARRIAESGMELALAELTSRQDAGSDGIGVASGLLNRGRFEITLTPPFMGSGRYVVHARGEFADQHAGFGAVVEVGGGDLFGSFGVFANDGVDFGGSSLVDSYDSSAGSYESQAVNSMLDNEGVPRFQYASSNGNVGTNGNVSITGSADVLGDLVLGPTGALVELSKPIALSGEIISAEEPRPLPPVAYDPPIAVGGSLLLEGDASESLSGGVHRFSSFTMDGHSALNIEGEVVLYVDGPFSMISQATLNIAPGSSLTVYHGSGDFEIGAGGIVNGGASPTSCQVMSATTGTVSFSASANFHGTIYAPDAFFHGGSNADLFGGFVAREALISGNMSIHVDESLRGNEETLIVEGIWELPLAEVVQLRASYGGGTGG